MHNLKELELALGVRFENPLLLEQALVHSSYCNENPGTGPGHNERLEFLGDAVLDFIVAEKLYADFPEKPEGWMSKRRAALVRRETLAAAAEDINLGAYLFLGKGEEATGGRSKLPNLAGALEAVIAAVYLDRGLASTRDLILRLLDGEWDNPGAHSSTADYKSRFQEYCQARFQEMPEYRLVGETGPAHDRRFSVEVTVNGTVAGRGEGKTKKQAETGAAQQALDVLKKDFTE